MPSRLTAYFIVEPPEYQILACYLAASLRENFGDTVDLVGYCPAHKMDLVQSQVKEVLTKLRCDLRPMQTEGRFDPAYPHGNKILATLEPRDTEFSCFMDSDILCLRPNAVENILKAGCVSLTPAASMRWGNQGDWERIYAAAKMEMPTERIRLMKQASDRQNKIPYFSSGLFSFPEGHRNAEGKSFPEVWMEVAQQLDAHADVPAKRPYLDQISLPLAILKSGLDWNLLPDEQHFILGGRARGEPLPEGREIYTVHYRQWQVLKETGLTGLAKQLLQKHAGIKKVTIETDELLMERRLQRRASFEQKRQNRLAEAAGDTQPDAPAPASPSPVAPKVSRSKAAPAPKTAVKGAAKTGAKPAVRKAAAAKPAARRKKASPPGKDAAE